MAVNHAMDAHIDKSSNTLTTMIADDRDDLRRRVAGYIGQGRQKDREGKVIRDMQMPASEITSEEEKVMREFSHAHPNHPASRKWLYKMQNVTNREQKAQVLAEMRDPESMARWEGEEQELKDSETSRKTFKKFIKENPESRVAIRYQNNQRAERERATALKKQRTKAAVGGAVRLARRASAAIAGTIVSLAQMGIQLFMKSNQLVSQIATDIRKRAIDEARLNLPPDTIRQWEIFAKQHEAGLDPGLLVQAAGGIQYAWGTPLNYTNSGFEKLGPYLGKATEKLTAMARAGGDVNVFGIMDTVIDVLTEESRQGHAGTKYGISVGQAFAENTAALSEHNAAWGTLFDRYWRDLQANGGDVEKWKVEDADGNIRKMTFENWRTQGEWNPVVIKSGLDSSVFRTAAEETNHLLRGLTGSLSNLAVDITTAIASGMGQTVENIRQILASMLSKWFPAFAAKEDQRAIILNEQSLAQAKADLPGAELEARKALFDLNYDGDLDSFKEVIDAIKKRDRTKLPRGMNIAQLEKTLSRIIPYYRTLQIIKDVEEQAEKRLEAGKEGKSHVTTHIVGDPFSAAAAATDEVLLLQNLLTGMMMNTSSPLGVPTSTTRIPTFKVIASFPAWIRGGIKKEIDKADERVLKRTQETVDNKTKAFESLVYERKYNVPGEVSEMSETDYKKGMTGLFFDTMEAHAALIDMYRSFGDVDSTLKAAKAYHRFVRFAAVSDVVADFSAEEVAARRAKAFEDWVWLGEAAAQVIADSQQGNLWETYRLLDENVIQPLEQQKIYLDEGNARLSARGQTMEETIRVGKAYAFIRELNGSILKDMPDLGNIYRYLAQSAEHSVVVEAPNLEGNVGVTVQFMVGNTVTHTRHYENRFGFSGKGQFNTSHAFMDDLVKNLLWGDPTQIPTDKH